MCHNRVMNILKPVQCVQASYVNEHCTEHIVWQISYSDTLHVCVVRRACSWASTLAFVHSERPSVDLPHNHCIEYLWQLWPIFMLCATADIMWTRSWISFLLITSVKNSPGKCEEWANTYVYQFQYQRLGKMYHLELQKSFCMSFALFSV